MTSINSNYYPWLNSRQNIFVFIEVLLSLILLIVEHTGSVNCVCNKVFKSTGDPQQGVRHFEAPMRLRTKPFNCHCDEHGNLIVKTTNETNTGYIIIKGSSNDSNLTNKTETGNSITNKAGTEDATTNDASKKKSIVNKTDTEVPIHCVYKFIGQEDERVFLNFSSFKLRGDAPECSDEYIDIYVELKPDDNFDEALVNGPGVGRFCSTIIPRQLVSLHNMIYIVFYSRLKGTINENELFAGSVSFAKSPKPHEQAIGLPEPGTLCTHTINVENKREGEFQSITYPGLYIKGLKCRYQFVGEPGQRIRLEFFDIDLYSGGSHCPMDSLKVFDGLTESDPWINTICGSHRNQVIFSTKENLLITFTTLRRQLEVQNRGFSVYFEFSDKFFDTTFIQGSNVKHVRGTECDQRIISNKDTRGVVVSPEPKNRSNAICRYWFEGIQNSTDYEKIKLKFIEFDLKTQRLPNPSSPTGVSTLASISSHSPTSVITSETTPSSDAAGNPSDQCPNNYVRVYTGEQKPDQKHDPNDYDDIYAYCSNDIPQMIESDAASLLMEYNSGTVGGFFRAEYDFMVDFRIPGNQSSSGCDYSYRSEFQKSGSFNSPRHPSWYIDDMNCSYTFWTRADESILLQFNTFVLNISNTERRGRGIGSDCRGEDSVGIFELAVDTNGAIISMTEIGTYCNKTTPGPILSYKPLRIIFKTNSEKVAYGFSALYNFYSLAELKTNDFVMNCGGDIHASHRQKEGVIASPETYRSETYEKRHHICSWNITARPSYRIFLDLDPFQLEGTMTKRGCITASVRIDLGGRDRTPIDLCGTIDNKTTHQYVSENERLSITFISTKQASGSPGFKATWTEIKRSD